MILAHIKLNILSALLAGLTVSFVLTTVAFSQTNTMETVKRTSDVIYGRKAGMALTLDVFEPAHKNGAGIIFLVSGGWASSHDDLSMVHVTPEVYSIYLARGYTVFAVVPVSSYGSAGLSAASVSWSSCWVGSLAENWTSLMP